MADEGDIADANGIIRHKGHTYDFVRPSKYVEELSLKLKRHA